MCFRRTYLKKKKRLLQPVSHVDPVNPGIQPRQVPSTTSHRPSKQF